MHGRGSNRFNDTDRGSYQLCLFQFSEAAPTSTSSDEQRQSSSGGASHHPGVCNIALELDGQLVNTRALRIPTCSQRQGRHRPPDLAKSLSQHGMMELYRITEHVHDSTGGVLRVEMRVRV